MQLGCFYSTQSLCLCSAIHFDSIPSSPLDLFLILFMLSTSRDNGQIHSEGYRIAYSRKRPPRKPRQTKHGEPPAAASVASSLCLTFNISELYIKQLQTILNTERYLTQLQLIHDRIILSISCQLCLSSWQTPRSKS